LAGEPDVVEGEFAGGQFGYEHCACGGEVGDYCGVGVDYAVFEGGGTPGGGIAFG
jgi:hypothetical protein